MNYTLSTTWTAILAAGILWELAWKSMAIWRAARNNQLGWYIALIIVNSVGVLPIIYLVSHKKARVDLLCI